MSTIEVIVKVIKPASISAVPVRAKSSIITGVEVVPPIAQVTKAMAKSIRNSRRDMTSTATSLVAALPTKTSKKMS